MKRRMVGGAVVALALVGAMVFAAASPAQAIGVAQHVALVENEGTVGQFPLTGFPATPFTPAPVFTDITTAQVAANANFLNAVDSCDGDKCDTVVLVQLCGIGALLDTNFFKADIENFVAQGGKLLIWDSGCNANDYSHFQFPFKTVNRGLTGSAGGGLSYAESNALGNGIAGNAAEANLVPIVEGTNAALGSNQFYTTDPSWCVSVSADVSGGTQGGVINYVKSGEGLVVYTGLNMSDMPGAGFTLNTDGPDQLNRLFANQLAIANFSSLPCSVKAQASVTLTPASQTQVVGQTAPLTAHVVSDGVPVNNRTVTLKVTSGPDVNLTPATAPTDTNGDAPFTYVSSVAGTDTLTGSVKVLDDASGGGLTFDPLSADATVTWTSRVATTAPIVNATPAFTG